VGVIQKIKIVPIQPPGDCSPQPSQLDAPLILAGLAKVKIVRVNSQALASAV
jgi:hypothetical protein